VPAGVYLDEMLGLAMEQQIVTRAAAAGLASFQIERAVVVRPSANDPAQLAYAASHDLVLVSRNVQDFLRLNELWTILREWGLAQQRHSGILLPRGSVLDRDWADLIMDLLFHPQCPTLTDELLLCHVATGSWESDHPYSSQRRRPVRL
jgi:hypothetical protein